VGSTLGVNTSNIQTAIKGSINFEKLESSVVSLAKSEGASSLVRKAINVTNEKLAGVLIKTGYTAEKIVDKFGRETTNYANYVKKITINQ